MITDPRVAIVKNAMLNRHQESMQEDVNPGLEEYAEVAIAALDAWLIKGFHDAMANGYERPRLYGHKFCNCTELVNEIMKRDTK